MKSVFLSYRRSDTEMLIGRIVDRLESAGFEVFYDVDKLAGGRSWKEQVRHAISACEVTVVLIGPTWLTDRLNNLGDPVRFEIALSLDLGKPVMPLLAGRTPMSSSKDLPGEIGKLTDAHALPIDIAQDFYTHINRIIASMRQLVGDSVNDFPRLDPESVFQHADVIQEYSYDWAVEVGERAPDILQVGMRVIYEERSLIPTGYDEQVYQELESLRIPDDPAETSPRGFIRLSADDSFWIDPRDRRRRLHDGTLKKVFPDGRVQMGGIPFSYINIADILDATEQ